MALINKWILLVFELTISLYAMINGWRILKYRQVYINPAHRIGLFFVNWIHGQEEASRRRQELTNPIYLTNLGKQMLLIGFVLLIVTLVTYLREF